MLEASIGLIDILQGLAIHTYLYILLFSIYKYLSAKRVSQMKLINIKATKEMKMMKTIIQMQLEEETRNLTVELK